MRVHHVKKARKDISETIKKGDSYYWWKFRYGGKVCSKTYPKRTQLTRSGFLQDLWSIEDEISAFSCSDISELESFREQIISDIENLSDECQNSLDNMPEHLQDTSDSGMLLNERIEALNNWRDEIEAINIDDETDVDEALGELQDLSSGL